MERLESPYPRIVLAAWLGSLQWLVVRYERRTESFLGLVRLGRLVVILGRLIRHL